MKATLLLSLFVLVSFFSCLTEKDLAEQTYYVSSISGSDSNRGNAPSSPWKSLDNVNQLKLNAGDRILLAEGSVFNGSLQINSSGSKEKPIVVSSYSAGEGKDIPVIDAKGYKAAIQIRNAGNLRISNLELTSDAGTPVEEEARTVRYGILVEADSAGSYPNLQLKNLHIHDIFATENINKDGQNPTSNMGYGIFIGMKSGDAKISNVIIDGCEITRTGHTGIRIFGHRSSSAYLDSLTIVNNNLEHIGGPGMVPGVCENILVRNNVVNYSGSNIDPRMHNRGSGIWPWTCNDVIIEKNKFMNAWGKMDSYGCHIDYNCKNVVVQYNLSVNNSGGFVEILGNNRNCSYRYNISINDGYREKGVKGVVHDGKLLWTSGYVGSNPRMGPFNSYIYNNTIFVKEEYDCRFSFAPTTDGLLIANNIFYIQGKSVDVKDNEVKNPDGSTIQNVVFRNNLYQRKGVIPESVGITDSAPLFGNPQFSNPGGLKPQDYIPQNMQLIKDQGITVENLPGDEVGLVIGLEVQKDYFGNPIKKVPDLGAIEIQ